MKQKRMILASASPRRKELMEQAGFAFEIRVSHKEEIYHSSQPDEIVKELALLKAEDVAASDDMENCIVIGADTVVAVDDCILGKPRSKEDAADMIRRIQGRAHQVYTGLAILQFDEKGNKTVINHAVRTDVYVAEMSEKEILEYVQSEDIMDKAGAYAIQGVFGAKFIRRIEGDYYNVVGLPISYIYQVLKEV